MIKLFGKILHSLLLLGVLLVVWYVLSGVQSPLFYAFGAFSALFALVVALRMNVSDSEGHPFHLGFYAPFYFVWLLWEMIKSGLTVTRLVWHPHLPISPAFGTLRSSVQCDLGRAILANSITLTPGTVCVDIDEDEVLVHALEKASIADLKAGKMDRKVARLTRTRAHKKERRV